MAAKVDMTVQHLIAILSTLPPSAMVVFRDEELNIYDGGRFLAQIHEEGAIDANLEPIHGEDILTVWKDILQVVAHGRS